MSETMELDGSFTRDPHPVLRRMQAEAPVSRVTMFGGVPVWLITRYADARTLLADPRLSKNRKAALDLFPPENDGPFESELLSSMLQSDPPDHTRLRKLVAKAFTMRATEAMRPQIEGIADELLDEIDVDVPVDLVEAYARPLPVRVISGLLGIPLAHRSRFQALLDPFLNHTTREQINAASAELTSMLTDVIADKRRHPTADLTSDLIAATDDGDRLSERELLATLFLLISAGYDTTVNLIANGILALLLNPAQLAALRADPSQMSVAVEEILRFDSPVNVATLRFTTEPIRVGDVEIGESEFVMISLLAANRDGARFVDPERLDISRKPNAHLAFGHGIHHCLGAALGRLEGRIALVKLLERFDRLELATTGDIEYRDSTLMHGLPTLPVRCHRTQGVTVSDSDSSTVVPLQSTDEVSDPASDPSA
jgi:cytochrome P450